MVVLAIPQKIQLKNPPATMQARVGMFMPMAPATSTIIRMITLMLGPWFRPRLQHPNQRAKSKASVKTCEFCKKVVI